MTQLTLEQNNLIVGTHDSLALYYYYYFAVKINFTIEYFCPETTEKKQRKAPELELIFKKQLPSISKLEKEIKDRIYNFIKYHYSSAIRPKPIYITYKICVFKP